MKLSKRLLTIQEMVPGGIAADVGSDHGKLIISLCQNNIILKGYGIENKKAPYTRLSKAILEAGLKDKITALYSDGISELPNDVDVVIIAGMGGSLIIDILKSHIEKLVNVKTIIIDAHNSVDKVREEIVSLGYFIQDEKLVFEDDIYYEIIRFDIGRSSPLDELDIDFGPILRKQKSPLFIQKYQQEIFEINNLLTITNLPENRKNDLRAKKIRLESVL